MYSKCRDTELLKTIDLLNEIEVPENDLYIYRSPTASVCSDASSLITAVGLETKKHFDTSTPDSAKHAHFDEKSLLSSK